MTSDVPKACQKSLGSLVGIALNYLRVLLFDLGRAVTSSFLSMLARLGAQATPKFAWAPFEALSHSCGRFTSMVFVGISPSMPRST